MRSIRLSLGLYFLGLLTLALGGASVMVYRSAGTTLADKEKVTLQLIKTRYEARAAAEQQQLDDRLLERALALAGRVQVETDSAVYNLRPLHPVGAVTAPSGPMAPLTALPWVMQLLRNPQAWNPREPRSPFLPPPFPTSFAWEIWRHGLRSVALNDSELELPRGGFDRDLYYQIDSSEPRTRPLRSASLEDRSLHAPAGFGEGRALHWDSDTLELAPGHPVRRVVVKASSSRRPPIPQPRPGSPRPGSTAPAGGPARAGSRYHIILQVAADLDGLNGRLDELTAERDDEFEVVRAETRASLGRLLVQLIAIAAVTFAATVAGTFWLVWLGLLPLHRLSEAVSRVSPRDFNLGIDRASLPAELTPVADKLAGTLAALKHAFDREKQATADISHELRTPLAAILMTTDLALRKDRTPAEYRELFQDAQTSAKHMNQMVERLLTLARLDAGVALYRPRLVDVAAVAEQCAVVVRPLAEASGLALRVTRQSAPGEAELTTDPDKLREVMNNLLHNAVQYNRPGGWIELSVGRENGHVRVEVRDSGVGIPAEARERIFERFFRGDPSRSSDGLNAGLGLAIVKEYIGLMAGRIDVESEEGQGTRFRVELPVR
ncbi:MAG: sensor histidine kinase [Gemmataceae bacterium]